jgi:phage antirepressor YoqD-like protein
MNTNIFQYNGNNITMKKENGNVYVNLTEIAKAFPDKNLSQIINSQEINEYVCELSKLQIYSLAENQLLTTVRGGNNPGTWAHQKVALRVCQKLSTQFAIWVDTKIEELLTTGVSTVYNDDEKILQVINLLQKRVEANRQRVQILEGENEQLTAEVKNLTPKAEYTDKVLQSDSTYTMTQVAKELGMSAVKLERKLHEKGIMFRQSGQWMLYAKYQGKGYTNSRTHTFTHSDGTRGTNTITVWTETGRAFVHWKFSTQVTSLPDLMNLNKNKA